MSSGNLNISRTILYYPPPGNGLASLIGLTLELVWCPSAVSLLAKI
jgi:hypothetical protein